MASENLKTVFLLWHILSTLVLPMYTENVGCNHGFERVGEWCFSFHFDGKSALQSLEICEQSGGKMVILDQQKKIETLRPLFGAKGIPSALPMKIQQEFIKSYQKLKDVVDYAERYCRIYKKYKFSRPPKDLFIPNRKLPLDFEEHQRANKTTPVGFSIESSSIPGAGLGAWTKTRVRMFTVLGEYEGEEHKDDRDMTYSWIGARNEVPALSATCTVLKVEFIHFKKIYEDEEEEKRHYIDAFSPSKSNWLRYINCARNVQEENVHSFPCEGLVFYMTTRDVDPDTELLTWYGKDDGLSMGITRIHPARDLKLLSAFYVRVRYRPEDDSGNYGLWDPFSTAGLSIQTENNYTYYAGTEGLPLPFICEHEPHEINI